MSDKRPGERRGGNAGKTLGRFAVLAAAVALVVPALAGAGNEVTKWNEIALNAIVGSPPTFPTPRRSVSAARLGRVRGDGAGGRLRRGQRGRPSRTPVSDQPELPEGVAGRCGRDGRVQGAVSALPGQQAAFDAAYAAR